MRAGGQIGGVDRPGGHRGGGRGPIVRGLAHDAQSEDRREERGGRQGPLATPASAQEPRESGRRPPVGRHGGEGRVDSHAAQEDIRGDHASCREADESGCQRTFGIEPGHRQDLDPSVQSRRRDPPRCEEWDGGQKRVDDDDHASCAASVVVKGSFDGFAPLQHESGDPRSGAAARGRPDRARREGRADRGAGAPGQPEHPREREGRQRAPAQCPQSDDETGRYGDGMRRVCIRGHISMI